MPCEVLLGTLQAILLVSANREDCSGPARPQKAGTCSFFCLLDIPGSIISTTALQCGGDSWFVPCLLWQSQTKHHSTYWPDKTPCSTSALELPNALLRASSFSSALRAPGWWLLQLLSSCYFACVLSSFGCVQLLAIPWTIAHQAPLSKEFSRQEYWSGLPCPSQGDLPDPGIEPPSLYIFGTVKRFFTLVPPGKPMLFS